MIWPPDYNAEFTRRAKLFQHWRANPDVFKIANHWYRLNPIAWIKDCCVTFDPRSEVKVMPFMLFPKQEEFIDFLQSCLTDKENGLVEKARDIGASWLCCAFSVWLWLYHPGTVIGWGSRKAEYVDKAGDPKAIFPKMVQIIENLPDFMLPAKFDSKQHITYMKIQNPENECVIAGEAGDNIGRGGRTTIFFKDESAHYERPELVEAALGDNTDVQIDISSVNGPANVFYRRRMAGEVWTPDATPEPGKVRVFIFDWRDHPAKTPEWYERRKKKALDEGLLHVFKQEVDRDYAGSLDGVIIPSEWSRACIDAHIKLGFDSEGLKIGAQDVADGGGDKNAFGYRHGVILRYADHWGGEAGAAAEIAIPICAENSVDELYYDSIGVGAGFKTQVNTMKERPTWPKKLRVYPWNAGGKVLDPEENSIPGDIESTLNKDQYGNLKAQGWFRLRARIYKTYMAVMHGAVYPVDELISFDSRIPKIHQLIMELSQAVRKKNGEGKDIVDKKPEGATSPNLADMVVECYTPTRELSILDVI